MLSIESKLQVCTTDVLNNGVGLIPGVFEKSEVLSARNVVIENQRMMKEFNFLGLNSLVFHTLFGNDGLVGSVHEMVSGDGSPRHVVDVEPGPGDRL